MQQKKHYIGLTDAEVLESRKKYGVNILTPPEKRTVMETIFGEVHRPTYHHPDDSGAFCPLEFHFTSISGSMKVLLCSLNPLAFLWQFYLLPGWLSILN